MIEKRTVPFSYSILVKVRFVRREAPMENMVADIQAVEKEILAVRLNGIHYVCKDYVELKSIRAIETLQERTGTPVEC